MQNTVNFTWGLFGVCVAALIFALSAIFLITRIIDNKWLDIKMPLILIIIFFAVVIIGAMFANYFIVS